MVAIMAGPCPRRHADLAKHRDDTVSEKAERTDQTLSVSNLLEIDKVCRQFESAWKAGDAPNVDDFLGRVNEALRDELRRELQAIDAELGGKPPKDPPSLEAFARRLIDSGLMTDAEYQAFYGSLPADARPQTAEDLAQEMHRRGLLTKFQAHAVYQGKTRGLVVGNYVVLDKVGQGGMGYVYKANHRKMDRVVALKVLPSSATRSVQSIRRFEREVRAAAKLSHPNIVTAYDADEAHGVRFLVMEFVEGKDLHSVVRDQGPLAVAVAVDCVLQAARGLEYAHGLEVIHRDIKPANLLWDRQGKVKILDMGLARVEALGAADQGLSHSGQLMGTPDYMAPEQALDAHLADARADVYGLGCTLYYLLTGRAPYGGQSIAQQLIAHREHPIPSLRAQRPDVPEWLDAVFRRMIAKGPEGRQQSMAEVIAQLQQGELPQGSTPPQTGPPPIPVAETLGLGRGDASTSSDGLELFLPGEASLRRWAPRARRPAFPWALLARLSKRQKIGLTVGLGAMFLLILLGVIINLRTADGTLVVEISEPGATVQVLSEEGEVQIQRKGEKGTISIRVDPGKHRLRVERDGFEIFTQEFSIVAGGKETIHARLEKTPASSTGFQPVEGGQAAAGSKPPPPPAAPPRGGVPPGLVPPGEWVDLLEYADLERDRVSGDWRQEGNDLVVTGKGDSSMMLPIVVDGAYEIEVKFTRTDGIGPVTIPICLRTIPLRVVLGDGTQKTPLSALERVTNWPCCPANPTARPGTLQNGRTYTVTVLVQPTGGKYFVQVLLDGSLHVECESKQTYLGLQLRNLLPKLKRPGLGAGDCTVRFRSARLRTSVSQAGGADKAYLLAKGQSYPEPYTLTQCPGPWGCSRFHDLAPSQAYLIGFEVHIPEAPDKPRVVALRPLYQSPSGPLNGMACGWVWDYPTGQQRVLAKDGYAVHGMVVNTGKTQQPSGDAIVVVGLKLLFARLRGARVDLNDTYESDWIGQAGTSVRLGGGDLPAIGLYGHASGFGILSLGLALAPDDPTVKWPTEWAVAPKSTRPSSALEQAKPPTSPDTERDFLDPSVASIPGAGKRIVNPKDGSILVLIPAGKFLAGKEKFEVELAAYYLGLHVVTNAQYRKFGEAIVGGPFGRGQAGRPPRRGKGDRVDDQSDHPVTGITWEDAEAYCRWADLRLPTELEWEKGARGVDGRVYPWGNQWDAHRCRNAEAPSEGAASVLAYPAGRSPWGVYDMAGNVWQYCADWYEENAYERYRRGDLSPPPVGPCRIAKGGGWASGRVYLRSDFHGANPGITWVSDKYGFRVAKSVTPEELDALLQPGASAPKEPSEKPAEIAKQQQSPVPAAPDPRGVAELLFQSAGDGLGGMAVQGDTVLIGGGNPPRLWSIDQRKMILELKGHTESVEGVALSADGRSALTGSADKTIRLWDVKTGNQLLQIAHPTANVARLALLGRERRALSIGDDFVIRLWDLDSRKELRSFSGHTAIMRSFSISPDESRLLTGSLDHTIRLWDLRSGECIRTMKTDGMRTVVGVVFLPNGRQALSGSYDRALRLWDLDSGKVVREFRGHTSAVWCVDVSPDGRIGVSGASNRVAGGNREKILDAIRFWDIATGQQIAAYDSFNDVWVRTVKFSPDGRWVYSCDNWGRVVRWCVPDSAASGPGAPSAAVAPDVENGTGTFLAE